MLRRRARTRHNPVRGTGSQVGRLAILMAGIAAEHVVLGRSEEEAWNSGGRDDFNKLDRLRKQRARRAIHNEDLAAFDRADRRWTRQREAAWSQACSIVRDNRHDVLAIAEILEAKYEITIQDVQGVFGAPLPERIRA